jgi:hypothetical protein
VRVTLVALAVMATVGVSAAQAARQPTPAERTAIVQTVKGFYEYWWYAKPGPIAGLKVSRVRVSTVDPHWAAADVAGPRSAGRPALVDRVLLWHAVKRWIVADAPSSEFIGCGVAPAAVNRDLFRGLGGC